ncbi:Ribbon-helix-helix protein, CopG [uncultured Caudovirales phage]|uniref:Ribbon-helix-helix protein, CopG n=1 Tax=uncultured Caudovirales phage TaxID=2100421 RepID=A0A6J5S5C8_9CAUD|nr:Ribbon-helix-helix protein, CopG [uncultured Caudovirales phage]
MKQKISISIDKNVAAALRARARDEGKPVSQIAEDAIRYCSSMTQRLDVECLDGIDAAAEFAKHGDGLRL